MVISKANKHALKFSATMFLILGIGRLMYLLFTGGDLVDSAVLIYLPLGIIFAILWKLSKSGDD